MLFKDKIKLGLISLGVGFAVTVLVLSLFSIIIAISLPDESLYSGFSLVAFSLGDMVAGYFYVRKTCKKGLISGITLGLIYFAAISLTGIFVYRSALSFNTVFRLICGILSGAIGGVVALNKCSADRKIS